MKCVLRFFVYLCLGFILGEWYSERGPLDFLRWIKHILKLCHVQWIDNGQNAMPASNVRGTSELDGIQGQIEAILCSQSLLWIKIWIYLFVWKTRPDWCLAQILHDIRFIYVHLILFWIANNEKKKWFQFIKIHIRNFTLLQCLQCSMCFVLPGT